MRKNNRKYIGHYKTDTNKWGIITSIRCKDLKKNNPTKWEHMPIYFKPEEKNEYKMHTRGNSDFFAWNPNSQIDKEFINGNKITIPHQVIPEIIKNLEILNLRISIKNHKLKSIQIKPFKIETYKKIEVYCDSKDENFEPIVDLVVYFSFKDNKNTAVVRDWGGRFIIDVVNKSNFSDAQKKRFHYSGIPFFELVVNQSIDFWDNENLVDYENKLKNFFNKGIYLNSDNNTHSNQSLGQKYKFELDRNIDLNQELDFEKRKNNDLERQVFDLNNEKHISEEKIINFMKNNQDKQEKINLLSKQTNKIETSSFKQRLLFSFKALFPFIKTDF